MASTRAYLELRANYHAASNEYHKAGEMHRASCTQASRRRYNEAKKEYRKLGNQLAKLFAKERR